MPVFYFDFTANDDVSIDTVGQELYDKGMAHKEAVKALAEIAAEEIPRDGKLVLTVTVNDAERHPLFKAQMIFQPAVEVDS